MLYPVGFKKEDFSKPQVGIASTWSMVTPCNMHINKLAEQFHYNLKNAKKDPLCTSKHIPYLVVH